MSEGEAPTRSGPVSLVAFVEGWAEVGDGAMPTKQELTKVPMNSANEGGRSFHESGMLRMSIDGEW